MAKITLSPIASTTDISKINSNFQKIVETLNERVLYRKNVSGESNTVQNDIDLNGKRIINLPQPVSANEAARLADVGFALVASEAAEQSANIAATAAFNAGVSSSQAAISAQAAIVSVEGTVKKVELASGDGSSVGVGAPVAVPYLQTLSDITNGSPISIFRFLPANKISEVRSLSTAFDSAPAIQLAVNSGAKRLVADYGLFNLESTVVFPGGISLEGSGDGTVFQQRSITQKASFFYRSPDAATLTDGFVFKNFIIKCTLGTFFEQQHLIEMSGVRNALVEGVKFYGPRGDGLYIGSGLGGEERHNENVQVRRCVFDGINNDNRNGISVIDVDGMVIEDSYFVRMTRANMPGPIDFEPDAAAYHVIRNVLVRRNRFRACGGNVSEISVYVPAAVIEPAYNVSIENNESDGYVGTGSFFSHNTNRLPTDDRRESVLSLDSNRVRNGNRPWVLTDAKGVRMRDNTWDTMKREALLGYSDPTNGLRDVSIDRDKFLRVGTVGGIGLSIFSVARLKMRDVYMEDCGTGGAGSYAVDFNTGTSSNVEIDGLNVTAPTGKTLVAIQKEAAHTFTAKTNKFYKGNLGGLLNAFQSHESDSLETSYLPVIGGSNTTGAGSYTSQLGFAKRIGTKAFVRINVTCDASHITNNTGIIEISLPWPCKQGGTNDTHIPLTVIGVTAATSSGQYGRLVQALTVGGVLGAVRTYYNSGGTQANVVVPNGPFTVLANFSYEVAEGY